MFTALLLLIAAGPANSIASIRVDLFELNHCHDELGRHCYDQVIMYEWLPDYRRHAVIAWYLVDDLTPIPELMPGGRYEVTMRRQVDSKQVTITARLFRETWTCHDPERRDKRLTPEENRRRLWSFP